MSYSYISSIVHSVHLVVTAANHEICTSLLSVNKKLSYRIGTMRHTMSVEMLTTVAQQYQESYYKGLQ